MTGDPRWQIVINPLSGGKRRHRRLAALVPQLFGRHGIPFDIHTTRYAGHAVEIAAQACDMGHRHFMSAGGDGTHHEVVNGLMSRNNADTTPTLALLPVGTGNDWSRVHRIPQNPARAVGLLHSGAARTIPVGRLQFGGGEVVHFVNATGLGLDACVVKAVSREAVRRFGKGAYLLSAVKQLFRYRPVHAALSGPGFERQGAIATIHAGFGRFVGGGMEFLPHGDPHGTQLALLTVAWAPRWKLLLQLYRLFNGSIDAYRGTWSTRTSLVEITTPQGLPSLVEADGELLGTTPLKITVIPEALQLIVPRRAR